MLEASVDRFGGSVAGAWPVKVGQNVAGPFLHRAAESSDLDQGGRDCCAQSVDQLLHPGFAIRSVGVAVGGDHRLVDAPGRFDLHVCVVGEQRRDSLLLFVGQQVRAGGKGSARRVQRIAGAAAVAEGLLLDAATTQSALRLVLGQPGISSQMIDNINASIHVRALLTDVFIVDEIIKTSKS